MTETKLNVNKVVAWYNAHGCNASKCARRFKVSRQTIHSYLNRIAKLDKKDKRRSRRLLKGVAAKIGKSKGR